MTIIIIVSESIYYVDHPCSSFSVAVRSFIFISIQQSGLLCLLRLNHFALKPCSFVGLQLDDYSDLAACFSSLQNLLYAS